MQWGQKSLEIVLQILMIYKSLEARYTGGSPLRKFPLTVSPLMLSPLTRSPLRDHPLLCNQDLGFSDPLPFVITFSTERNQKLPFSDNPLPPFVIT